MIQFLLVLSIGLGGGRKLIKKTFSDDIAHDIGAQEEKIYNAILLLASQYQNQFNKYQCGIECQKYWYNWRTNTIWHQRPCFCDGYVCACSCSIMHEGELVCIDKIEGSILTASWVLSSITREKISKLKKYELVVSIFEDTEEIIEDLTNFLEILGKMKFNL